MKKDLSMTTDEKLVELFFARKEEAVELSEKKYGKYLFSLAKNVLGDEEDSRECVNDALFLLWTHIPPDRPKCFKAYISRLIRNLAIDRTKEQSRKKRVPSEYIACFDELSEFLEDSSNVEKEYDDKLLKECLDRFVLSLNEKQRTIFVCRYYFSVSVKEIAEKFDCSEWTVFKTLDKMKKQLKELLRKEGFIHE